MAKQRGPIYLKGTAGLFTYYRMGGRYYVRNKTSLDKERFYQDAAFAGSRKAAGVFGIASKIASEVYRVLPQKHKGHGVIGRLSGKANRLLHAGKSKKEVVTLLLKVYGCTVPEPDKKETLKPVKELLYTPEKLLRELGASFNIEVIIPIHKGANLLMGALPLVPT